MRLRSSAALACIAFAVPAWSIAPNTGADSTFKYVGLVAGGCGIAIGDHSILLAHHAGVPNKIYLDDAPAGIDIDPNSGTRISTTDITVFHTVQALPGWYNLVNQSLAYSWTLNEDAGGNITDTFTGNSSPAEIMMVGYGDTSTLNAGGTGYDPDEGQSGIRRAAAGRVDYKGDLTLNPADGKQSFIGSHLSKNGDGVLLAFDSGGAYMVNVGGEWQVAGLNAAVANAYNDQGQPIAMPFTTIGNLNGVWSIASDLFPYRSQILAAVPEPASLTALTFGALALLRRRRNA